MKVCRSLFLVLWFVACVNTSTTPTPEAEEVGQKAEQPTSLEDRVQAASATVTFQGLMAFVTNGAQTFPITALLVDADRRSPGRALPNVVSQAAVNTNQLYLPAHEAYIAFDDNAEIEGCQFENRERLYLFNAETNSAEYVNGYKLCGGRCNPKEINLRLGQEPNRPVQVDLEGLVDGEDLRPNCSREFFKISGNINDEIIASIKIETAGKIEARVVPDYDGIKPTYGYRTLKNNLVTPRNGCAGTPRELAEEVVLSGVPPVTIELNGNTCTITQRETTKPVRVWFFNMHPGSFQQNRSPHPHHEAFYWFYDLAPAACSSSDGQPEYLSPCEFNEDFGDPKCPIARLGGI